MPAARIATRIISCATVSLTAIRLMPAVSSAASTAPSTASRRTLSVTKLLVANSAAPSTRKLMYSHTDSDRPRSTITASRDVNRERSISCVSAHAARATNAREMSRSAIRLRRWPSRQHSQARPIAAATSSPTTTDISSAIVFMQCLSSEGSVDQRLACLLIRTQRHLHVNPRRGKLLWRQALRVRTSILSYEPCVPRTGFIMRPGSSLSP